MTRRARPVAVNVTSPSDDAEARSAARLLLEWLTRPARPQPDRFGAIVPAIAPVTGAPSDDPIR